MRPYLVIIHRYVGLAIAGFLVMAGLTGSVIAFEQEIDAALNPRLFKVRPAAALPLDEMIARVERTDPRIRVAAIELPASVTRSARLKVEARHPARPVAFDEMFVDPASGAVLGQRLWGACCLGSQQAVPFLYKLHYSLHVPGVVGAYLLAGVAILWFFDNFVGLSLAWPRGSKARSWKLALSIKRGASPYRFWFDFHRASGLWVWLLLGVMATTAITVSLRTELFRPVLGLFSPLTPDIADLPAPDSARPQSLSYQDAIRIAERQGRGLDGMRAVYVLHAPALSLYGVGLGDGRSDPRDGLGPSWVYVDDRTGVVRRLEKMGRGSAGDVLQQAQLPLHNGRIFGMFGRSIVAALGVIVAGLSLSGVIIWSRKRKLQFSKAALGR